MTQFPDINVKPEDALSDTDAEHIRHTRIGVWDFYEDSRHLHSAGRSRKFLERLEEALLTWPYVVQTLKTLLTLSHSILLLYVVAVLVTSLMPAASVYYSGQLLRVLQQAIDSRTVDTGVLFRVLFARIACTMLTRFANLTQNWASIRISSKMRSHYSEHILQAHLRLDLPTFNDPAVRGQLASVLSSRSNAAWIAIKNTFSIFSTLLMLVSQLSVLIGVLKDHQDGILLAIVSFTDPVWSWMRRESNWRGGVWAATCRNLDYIRIQGFKSLADGENYRKELVAGNLEEYIVTEFKAAQNRIGEDGDLTFHEAQQQMQNRKESFSLLAFFHNILGELPQVVFTLRAIQSPRSMPVSMASLTLIRSAVGAFTQPLLALLSQSTSISDAFASIRRLYEIINIENQVLDGTKPFPEDAAKVKHGVSIEFKNVSFKYPGTDEKYALQNVSFKIEAGQLCIIVGFNGSGKSTILKLLNRLYDPTEGNIFIDNHDIKTLNLTDLRRSISVLFQDYTHFPLSIKENIGMGDPVHAHDEDRIRQAAQLGGAADVIDNLPDGYETFLHRPVRDYYSGLTEGKRGQTIFGRPLDTSRLRRKISKSNHRIELSGGQMQKLAVSRTFMRSLGEDSRVGLLLFDEPSASLDPTAEHDLFERLRKLRGSKTMVFSSHRFGQLTKAADVILYMADSTVVERGNHEQLLKQDGGYAKMYNLQASQFR